MATGTIYLERQATAGARASLNNSLTASAFEHASDIGARLERARSVTSLVASTAPLLGTDGSHPGSAAGHALDRLARVYPAHGVTATLSDRGGRVLARFVRGRQLPVDRVVAVNPQPAWWLDPGATIQSRPYRSAVTGEQVVATVSPVFSGGRPRAMLRLEIPVASLDIVAAGQRNSVIVADRRTGKVVINHAEAVAGPEGTPLDERLKRLVDGAGRVSERDLADDAGRVIKRASLRRVVSQPGNFNDWYVIALGDPPNGASLLGRAAIPFLVVAVLLALLGLLLARRGSNVLAGFEREFERVGELRLDAIARNSSDLVTVVGKDGAIRVQTGATHDVLGIHPEQLEGLQLEELIHPEDRVHAAAIFADLGDTGDHPQRIEWRMRHGDGSWRHFETSVARVAQEDSIDGFVLTSRDIEARRALEGQLRHRAFHDPLTELPNRALFYDRIGQSLARRRSGERLIAVMFLDVDDFKLVNDRHGHAAGDEMLVAVGQRLRTALRTADTVARLGGDEFGVLLEDVDSRAGAEQVAERILSVFREPLEVGDELVFIRTSIGVALGAPQKSRVEEMLRCADVAMYAAKRAGKGCYEVFDEHSGDELIAQREPVAAEDPERLTWFVRGDEQREEIEELLAGEDQIATVFQPLVDMRTGDVKGYEALSRFTCAGDRPPNAWFAQAARSGLGAELEAKAVAVALASARELPADAYLSVNLSPSSLLAPEVGKVLPADLSGIVIEITENELLDGGQRLAMAITRLRARGGRIAIDDAGAGYAGLKHLMLLRPDVVKLDRALVDGISGDPAKQALIDAFVRFARHIGAGVCAEGIERIEDLVALADLDVELGQGYVIGRPAGDFAEASESATAALREATAAAQRFGPDGSPGPAFASNRQLEFAAERLAGVNSYDDLGPALQPIADALGAGAICISRVVASGGAIRTTATRGLREDRSIFTLSAYPATRAVIETGEALQVVQGDSGADAAELAELGTKGFGSLLMVPILSHGSGVGLLEAFATERRAWSRLALARARLFAYQLGPLLEKLDAREQEERQGPAGNRSLRRSKPARAAMGRGR